MSDRLITSPDEHDRRLVLDRYLDAIESDTTDPWANALTTAITQPGPRSLNDEDSRLIAADETEAN